MQRHGKSMIVTTLGKTPKVETSLALSVIPLFQAMVLEFAENVVSREFLRRVAECYLIEDAQDRRRHFRELIEVAIHQPRSDEEERERRRRELVPLMAQLSEALGATEANVSRPVGETKPAKPRKKVTRAAKDRLGATSTGDVGGHELPDPAMEDGRVRPGPEPGGRRAKPSNSGQCKPRTPQA
jgi:hypothetical protein